MPGDFDNMVQPTQTYIPLGPAQPNTCPGCGRCRTCGQPVPITVQPWPALPVTPHTTPTWTAPWTWPTIVWC